MKGSVLGGMMKDYRGKWLHNKNGPCGVPSKKALNEREEGGVECFIKTVCHNDMGWKGVSKFLLSGGGGGYNHNIISQLI